MVAGCVQQPVSQRDQPRLGGLSGQSATVRKGSGRRRNRDETRHRDHSELGKDIA